MIKINFFEFNLANINNYKYFIIDLLKQSFSKSFPNQNIDESYYLNRIKKLKKYIRNSQAKVYAVEEENKLIGFIWFYQKENIDKKVIHIVHFVVDKEYRNSGLGTKLLQMVENHAKKIGVKNIELLVTKNNRLTLNFYKNHEFETVRFVMEKQL